ncbi:hypothetical protein C8Q73DRAFT_793597 [Cubamyces lactineus]|nr:hypothetical protein C8Q73DRAFT_793597 [Cubamyces lactineus]
MAALTETINLLAHLGGLELAEDHIAWAADIPAGKRLLEWLANQMHIVDGESSHPAASIANRIIEDSQDLALQAIVSPISLYEDESSILSALANHASEGLPGNSTSSAYEPPSTLRFRATSLEHEAELLQARAARLKRRNEGAKSETKRLKASINASQQDLIAADEIIQEQQRRLADLSVQADNTIGICTEKAGNLLENASGHDKNRIYTLRSELAHLERGRLAVTQTVERLHRVLDDAYDTLPEGLALQEHATMLDSRLRKFQLDPTNASSLIAASYEDELGRMTTRIKLLSQNDTESLEHLIQSESQPGDRETTNSTLTLSLVPDVKVELERAGLIDRVSLLAHQERGLDLASNDLRDKLLPRLQRCYDVLHSRNTSAVEAEVVISALIEELEDINDVVEDVRRADGDDSDQIRVPEDPNRYLEVAVIDLLKRLLRSRTDRPTVLLDQSDVEIELASLADKSASVRKSEVEWASRLAGHLHELSKSRAALLNVTYENSPLNTSAPFAPCSEEAAARDDALSHGEVLRKEASRLQKESEPSSRDKRKLVAFVEKWNSK